MRIKAAPDFLNICVSCFKVFVLHWQHEGSVFVMHGYINATVGALMKR